MGKVSNTLSRWQQNGQNWMQRGLDRSLRLAVTGLSRSGKTAFITALIHQLENAGTESVMPLWQIARQGRILGCQRVPQLNHHIPTFDYAGG
ncbi:YcjX family protein [Dongshaea marina]|uniref:YcjX family protein n=1 Tax=Dongshaea marina TaxID=2047966 RepID=UPI0022791AAB|nr:YcjX family protein [Dongshaea marina]